MITIKTRRRSTSGASLWTVIFLLMALGLLALLLTAPAVLKNQARKKMSERARNRPEITQVKQQDHDEEYLTLEGYEEKEDTGKARSHRLTNEADDAEYDVDKRFDFDDATPVTIWGGNTQLGTETFRIETKEWAVAWKTMHDDYHSNQVSIRVKSSDNKKKNDHQIRITNSESSYNILRNGPGEFYLEIQASMTWQIAAFDMSGRKGLIEGLDEALSPEELAEALEGQEEEKPPRLYHQMSYSEVSGKIGRPGQQTSKKGIGDKTTITYMWYIGGLPFEAEFENGALAKWTGSEM